ncbi:MAG TPA: RNA polymerase sigma factor [Chitinophagaceae bacterium]|nr:RNA polymerase sigma factor [Chitinophagaceae bacterium]
MENLIETIKKCIEQDKKYQRKFYERYFGFAMKAAFRYITDFDRAKDVVHDSFIKIFNNLPQFMENTAAANNLEYRLMSWMKRIIVNTGIDFLRRDKSSPKLTELDERVWDEHAETISAEANVLYKELLLQLSRLSPTYRVVFNLHAVDGYTHKEIGEMLNLTTGGVKSIYFKAKDQLQKKLNDMANSKSQYVKP